MTGRPFVACSRRQWASIARDGPGVPPGWSGPGATGDTGVDRAEVEEVEEVYAPLAVLVRRHLDCARSLRREVLGAVGAEVLPVPFTVAVAGSVAVGKSTLAHALARLLRGWPDTGPVEVVPTDGFLFANAELRDRGLLARKGFPETYDTEAMVGFLAAVKSGADDTSVPVYSHATYDIVAGERRPVGRPDILILEGVNVLQATVASVSHCPASDFVDLAVYVDADPDDIERWFVERFLALCAGTSEEASFYRQFAAMGDAEAAELARTVWRSINRVNLEEHIAPSRWRADVIVEKGPDHAVRRVLVRSG